MTFEKEQPLVDTPTASVATSNHNCLQKRMLWRKLQENHSNLDLMCGLKNTEFCSNISFCGMATIRYMVNRLKFTRISA